MCISVLCVLQLNQHGVEMDVEGIPEIGSVDIPDMVAFPEGIKDEVNHILSRSSSDYGIDIYRDCLEALQRSM